MKEVIHSREVTANYSSGIFFGGKKTYGQILNILNVAIFTYLIDPTEGQTVEFYSLQKAYDGTICSEEAIESEKAPWTMLRIRQLRLK